VSLDVFNLFKVADCKSAPAEGASWPRARFRPLVQYALHGLGEGRIRDLLQVIAVGIDTPEDDVVLAVLLALAHPDDPRTTRIVVRIIRWYRVLPQVPEDEQRLGPVRELDPIDALFPIDAGGEDDVSAIRRPIQAIVVSSLRQLGEIADQPALRLQEGELDGHAVSAARQVFVAIAVEGDFARDRGDREVAHSLIELVERRQEAQLPGCEVISSDILRALGVDRFLLRRFWPEEIKRLAVRRELRKEVFAGTTEDLGLLAPVAALHIHVPTVLRIVVPSNPLAIRRNGGGRATTDSNILPLGAIVVDDKVRRAPPKEDLGLVEAPSAYARIGGRNDREPDGRRGEKTIRGIEHLDDDLLIASSFPYATNGIAPDCGIGQRVRAVVEFSSPRGQCPSVAETGRIVVIAGDIRGEGRRIVESEFAVAQSRGCDGDRNVVGGVRHTIVASQHQNGKQDKNQ